MPRRINIIVIFATVFGLSFSQLSLAKHKHSAPFSCEQSYARHQPAAPSLSFTTRPIVVSKDAKKDLSSVPKQIAEKFQSWMNGVERQGLEEIRKIPGFHDEPLKGDRENQHSVRLNQAYRMFYTIEKNGPVETIYVEEVNHHKY